MKLSGKLNGRQRLRLPTLLDMLYTHSELASEVGFTVRQVYRVYVPLGCPVIRDEKGRLYINGKLFSQWYFSKYKK